MCPVGRHCRPSAWCAPKAPGKGKLWRGPAVDRHPVGPPRGAHPFPPASLPSDGLPFKTQRARDERAHCARRAELACNQDALLHFDRYLCSLRPTRGGWRPSRVDSDFGRLDKRFPWDLTISKSLARWALLLYVSSTDPERPRRFVLPSRWSKSWPWMPSANNGSASSCGAPDDWLRRDVCSAADIAEARSHRVARSGMEAFASRARAGGVERGSRTKHGLWWASQLVRRVLSSLGPCGSRAVRSLGLSGPQTQQSSCRDRGVHIALQIRRADACERWATPFGAAQAAPAAGRPCFLSKAYLEAARSIIANRLACRMLQGVKPVLLVASDSAIAWKELHAASNGSFDASSRSPGSAGWGGVEEGALIGRTFSSAQKDFIEFRNARGLVRRDLALASFFADLRAISRADAFVGTAASWTSRLAMLNVMGHHGPEAVPPHVLLDRPFGWLWKASDERGPQRRRPPSAQEHLINCSSQTLSVERHDRLVSALRRWWPHPWAPSAADPPKLAALLPPGYSTHDGMLNQTTSFLPGVMQLLGARSQLQGNNVSMMVAVQMRLHCITRGGPECNSFGRTRGNVLLKPSMCGAGCALSYNIKPLMKALIEHRHFVAIRSLFASRRECGSYTGKLACFFQPFGGWRGMGGKGSFVVDPADDAFPTNWTRQFALSHLRGQLTRNVQSWFWLISQLLAFFMRPADRLKSRVDQVAASLQIDSPQHRPLLSLHVRLGDACTDWPELLAGKGRACRPLAFYMPSVRKMIRRYGYKAVFLATDSIKVVREAQSTYPEVRWLFQRIDRARYEAFNHTGMTIENVLWPARFAKTVETRKHFARVKDEANFSPATELDEFLIDVYLMARSDGLVGDFTSNMDRHVYALMSAYTSPSGTHLKPFISVGGLWCFDFKVLAGRTAQGGRFWC